MEGIDIESGSGHIFRLGKGACGWLAVLGTFMTLAGCEVQCCGAGFFWAGFGILKSLQLRLSAQAAKASLGAVKVNKFGSSSAHTVWLWTASAGVRTKAAI